MGLMWLIELFVQVNKFYWGTIVAHYFYTAAKNNYCASVDFIESNAINLIFELLLLIILELYGALEV